MLTKIMCLFWIYLLLTAAPVAATSDEWQAQATHTLQQWLQSEELNAVGDCRDQESAFRKSIVRFYRLRGFEPAWMDRDGWLPAGHEAFTAMRRAVELGVLVDDLPFALSAGSSERITLADAPQVPEDGMRLDLALTQAVLRFATRLTQGQVEPVIKDYLKTPAARSERDLAAELASALVSSELTSFLEQLGPRQAGYHALQQSLIHYRDIQRTGGWTAVSDGPLLKQGICGPRVAELRQRLIRSADHPMSFEPSDECFDQELEASVMRFQHRHGLSADGFVGADTLAALNIAVDQRIRQIELNLERFRWMPENLGAVHVLVNIPGYQLKVMEQGHAVQTMRIIVGRPHRPTPVMSSRITYLEINPYWHVPPKIAREDLLPKIQKDVDYFIRQDFRVFDSWQKDARELDPYAVEWTTYNRKYFPLRLVQEPTALNALGRVKFMFPNEQSVYIHDTPSKNLFAEAARNLSSGCVRVEKPLELLSYFLERQNWEAQRVSTALESGTRQVVVLKDAVPVHLLYFTAWVEDGGEIQFREDIYGLDRQLFTALTKIPVDRQMCDTIPPGSIRSSTQSAKNQVPDSQTTSAGTSL